MLTKFTKGQIVRVIGRSCEHENECEFCIGRNVKVLEYKQVLRGRGVRVSFPDGPCVFNENVLIPVCPNEEIE